LPGAIDSIASQLGLDLAGNPKASSISTSFAPGLVTVAQPQSHQHPTMVRATVAEGYKPEGRLGDDDAIIGQDPRLNQRLLKGLTAFGLDKRPPETDLTIDSPMEAITEFMGATDAGMQGMYDSPQLALPVDENAPKVNHTIETIKGKDDHEIPLHVFRLAKMESEAMPGLLYTHGGGMSRWPNIISNDVLKD
jgi:hypothetical protein